MKRLLIAICPAAYGVVLFVLGISSGERLLSQIATAPASWVMMAASTGGGDVSLVRAVAFVAGSAMLIGWYPFIGYALLAANRRKRTLLFVCAMTFQYMTTAGLVAQEARQDGLGSILLNPTPGSIAFGAAYFVGQVGLWMIVRRMQSPSRRATGIRAPDRDDSPMPPSQL